MPGSKPGERRGGRQKGTPNQKTVAREKAQAQAAARITEALGPDTFPGDAHAYLVTLYKDPRRPDGVRIDAAKAAIAFEKPRLSSVDGGSKRTSRRGRLSWRRPRPNGRSA